MLRRGVGAWRTCICQLRLPRSPLPSHCSLQCAVQKRRLRASVGRARSRSVSLRRICLADAQRCLAHAFRAPRCFRADARRATPARQLQTLHFFLRIGVDAGAPLQIHAGRRHVTNAATPLTSLDGAPPARAATSVPVAPPPGRSASGAPLPIKDRLVLAAAASQRLAESRKRDRAQRAQVRAALCRSVRLRECVGARVSARLQA